MTSLSLVCG